MNGGSTAKLIRAGAALLLLLAAGLDLAFPQLCEEDSRPLLHESSTIDRSPDTAGRSGDAEPVAPPKDDCFCCCSHVLAYDFGPAGKSLQPVTGSASLPEHRFPQAPIHEYFRPPRIA